MRLKSRTIKRRMFTCTECAQCISACDQVQQGKPGGGLLQWVEGERALPVASECRPSAQAHRDTAEA
jgi:ferredoxin-type protein NapH